MVEVLFQYQKRIVNTLHVFNYPERIMQVHEH